MISEIKKILKRFSTFIQRSNDSFVRHNREYEVQGKIDSERAISQEYFAHNLINSPQFKAVDMLTQYPVSTVIDVGSGTGWASAALAKDVERVIGIEPSFAAIEIAKELYSNTDYPNITWMQGYAEDVLVSLKLKEPAMFITGCVLSHLRDKEVLKICEAINAIAPTGSTLAFSECWSESAPWHQIMWHIRTTEWWKNALPGWELDFHGPLHEHGNCHMGFSGVKKV